MSSEAESLSSFLGDFERGNEVGVSMSSWVTVIDIGEINWLQGIRKKTWS